MEQMTETNAVRLCGTLAGAPVFSHESRGQRFYSFPLEVRRLSGNSDTLNIVLRREQLEAVEAAEREKLATNQGLLEKLKARIAEMESLK